MDHPDRQSGERLADPMIGRTLAERYVIEGLLSEGGMGRVYRGVQRVLDRPVAIKCIHPHLMTAESVVSRFLEEARVASRLTHPNIVEIYDFGQTPADQGGHFFIVMELLEGMDLAQKLRESPLPFPTVVDILGQVLSALGEAHDNGVTHRDAKPENVILLRRRSGAYRVKLIDFGIAKSSGGRRLTQVGAFVGSPNYMPPEQINGQSADVSADLYAVGAILFEALTGQVLFDDDNLMTILQRQLTAPRPDPREVAPARGIPAQLAELCLRAIDIDPEKRFQTAEEFAEALEAARRASFRPPAASRDETSGTKATMLQSGSPVPGHVRDALAASAPPKIRSIVDGNADPTRRSVTAPKQVTLRYRVVQRASTFEDLERLEQRASAALSRGDRVKALSLFMGGVDQARALVTEGEVELASVAFGSFGRRAAALLREEGRPDDARRLVADVLDARGVEGRARALLMEQLFLAYGELGQTVEAERARSGALALARAQEDVDLVKRLSPRGVAEGSPRESDSPPVKRSELRARRKLAARLGRIDKAR